MALKKAKKKRIDKGSPFKCKECGKTNARRYDMESIHIVNYHGGVGAFTDCYGNEVQVRKPVKPAFIPSIAEQPAKSVASKTPLQTAITEELAPTVVEVEPVPLKRGKKKLRKVREGWAGAKQEVTFSEVPVEGGESELVHGPNREFIPNLSLSLEEQKEFLLDRLSRIPDCITEFRKSQEMMY